MTADVTSEMIDAGRAIDWHGRTDDHGDFNISDDSLSAIYLAMRAKDPALAELRRWKSSGIDNWQRAAEERNAARVALAEAVEILRTFSELSEWQASAKPGADEVYCDVADLRAARAFVEKHGGATPATPSES